MSNKYLLIYSRNSIGDWKKAISNRFYVGMILPSCLWCEISHLRQHILNKNTVARGGVVYENVCHRAHQLSVLDDRATAQVCSG